MISGRTTLIAHLGYPTESFTAPMIYNPWFERKGIDAVVVPMGVGADDYPAFLRLLFRLSNIHGALVTMPHKVTTAALLDEVSLAVKIAGSCNAILRRDDGSLYGDMFDGEGFTRGARRRGFDFAGADCLVVGAGGVGSAIAAAIAAQRPRSLAICDTRRDAVESLVLRLRRYYPDLAVEIRNKYWLKPRLLDLLRQRAEFGGGTPQQRLLIRGFALLKRRWAVPSRDLKVSKCPETGSWR